MQMTDQGLALIKRFEGFRAHAYKCPAGVWTIGYGHTEGAGPPPVAGGMELSEEKAAEILRTDVATFAAGVAASLRRDLDPAQFSALVSFAYNVGLTNFRKSSVLAAANAGDFAAVPRRLLLWNKANGRVLPGLVSRRAAEGELFAGGARPEDPRIDPGSITPSEGPSAARTSTGVATGAAAAAGALASLWGHGWIAALVLLLVIAGAAVWILRHRQLLSKLEGL